MGKYLYLQSVMAAIIITVIALTSCLHNQPTASQEQVVEIDSTEIPIVAERMGAYFLLRNSDDTLSLNKYEDDKIVVLRNYDINKNSIYKSDGQSRVAVLDTTRTRIRIYDIKLDIDTILDIPYHLVPKCILINDDYLFVGGGLVDEILIGYHFESKQWFKLEIPDHMRLPGKEIDDLLLNGDVLIAIDNLIMPKYVLFYRLNEGGKVCLIETKELKSNGPYESIKKGSLSPKYFGLMSDTHSGYTGLGSHITIYKGLGMKESFSVSTYESKIMGYIEINDFCIIDSTVWIAYKGKGLGKLLINESWFTKEEDQDLISYYDISEVDFRNVKFETFTNGEVEQFTRIPNTSKVIVTIKKEGVKKRQHVIKE